MSTRRLAALLGLMFFSGCLYGAREKTDEVTCELATYPYDVQPPLPPPAPPQAPATLPMPEKAGTSAAPVRALDVRTAAWMQADADLSQPEGKPRFPVPKVPPEIPGSEATLPLRLPKDPEERRRLVERLYPPLPPLPKEAVALPGPHGQPYTLADLQQIAAENSPTLRQATSDVQAARGALIQAGAYPNPTVGYEQDPSNDGSVAGVHGFWVDQVIKFHGKLKLARAAAEMDLANAELALRRARSDLATAVRTNYFAVLVAKETVRVTKALAEYTDKIYVLQAEGLLKAGGFAAPYEPAALRGLAYSARLGYKQANSTYIYAWQQLVAALGLPHLPLSEVAGRIDKSIPYYDYDTIRAYVLRNHTDVLTTGNAIDKARYNLKLAQITPYPDVEVAAHAVKELSLPPKQWTQIVTVSVPFPIWDRNKGNIMAAEAALVRATEEPHRVAEALTNSLAIAYAGYKNNLDALEYYRRFILPDSVRYYQGVYRRRNIDISGVAFSDLVTSQQTLAANVTAYLGILGSLWASTVSVADLLQTDDMFQLAKPYEVPPLPDLDHLPPWPCCHLCPPPHGAAPGCAGGCGPLVPAPPPGLLPPPEGPVVVSQTCFEARVRSETEAAGLKAGPQAPRPAAGPAPPPAPDADPTGSLVLQPEP
jgi:cobalt-zinc-cadmium efflux system outer membrane protein